MLSGTRSGRRNSVETEYMKILMFLALASSLCVAQLPNKKLTPGAIRTTSTMEVCKTTTPQFRHTTPAMKKQACAAYGVKNCPKAGEIELDHLVSLELGGADSIENLWPQFAKYKDGSPGFHEKDQLENQLHRAVCAGQIKLTDAQQCIRSNWIRCAKKMAAKK
jgi:hypothetical protein